MLFFYRIYNIELMSMPVLPLTDNIQKCLKPPDCLLGVVTQPANSRLSKTSYVDSASGQNLLNVRAALTQNNVGTLIGPQS